MELGVRVVIAFERALSLSAFEEEEEEERDNGEEEGGRECSVWKALV